METSFCLALDFLDNAATTPNHHSDVLVGDGHRSRCPSSSNRGPSTSTIAPFQKYIFHQLLCLITSFAIGMGNNARPDGWIVRISLGWDLYVAPGALLNRSDRRAALADNKSDVRIRNFHFYGAVSCNGEQRESPKG